MPRTVVSDNSQGGVREARLSSKHHLWDIGHVDYVETPTVEELGLTTTRKSGPLDCYAAAFQLQARPISLRTRLTRLVDFWEEFLGSFYENLQQISQVLENRF